MNSIIDENLSGLPEDIKDSVKIDMDTKYTIDLDSSEKYSEKERETAVDVILAEFERLDGCTLNSLTYLGDEEAENNLEYVNSLKEEKTNYIDAIVFGSSFISPPDNGEISAWEYDTEYTWTWVLARETDGQWELMTYGY